MPPESSQRMISLAKSLLDAADDEVARQIGDEEDAIPEWSYALAVEALQAARLPNPHADPAFFEFYAPEAQAAGWEIGSLLYNVQPDIRSLVRCIQPSWSEMNELDKAIEKEAIKIIGKELPAHVRLLSRLSWFERQAFLLGFWIRVSGNYIQATTPVD